MGAMVATATQMDAVLLSARQDPTAAESEWLRLLNSFAEPACVVECGLAEALITRQHLQAAYPRQAAVLGADKMGLLATLLLRLRGIAVVTLGDVLQPLLTPRRLQMLSGWRHVGMSPALDRTQLVVETGAHYVSTRELTLEEAKDAFGPFDLIVAKAAEFSVLKATRGLAEKGVLLDLAEDATVEIWAASPTPCLLVRHQVALKTASSDRVAYERAVKDLAFADLQYPGWLARAADALNAGPQERGPS